MKEGFNNEYQFAISLNKKKYVELPNKFKELIKSLYPDIKDFDKIECWVSKYNEKSDIKIRVNGIIKGASIKMGKNNSVHLEHIDDFMNYLIKIGIDEITILKLKHYFNWSKREIKENNKIYKRFYNKNINLINSSLNDFYIKFKLFSRFLFEGNTRFNYSAHIIIHGSPSNFYWATRNEVISYLLNSQDESGATIKIGQLSLQVYERSNKQFIQIKWHTLEKALITINKNRKSQLINNIK